MKKIPEKSCSSTIRKLASTLSTILERDIAQKFLFDDETEMLKMVNLWLMMTIEARNGAESAGCVLVTVLQRPWWNPPY